MSNRQVTEESFLKDVAKHEMKVLKDDGIYRHLRFASTGQHSWNQWFEIVTFPDKLVYSGDMGTYVFARLEDMFQFFRTDRRDEHLGINLSYWGEKLEAVDRNGREGGHRVFSEEKLRENIEEHIQMFIEDFEAPYDSGEEETAAAAKKSFEEELRQAIEDDVYYYLDENEHESRKAVNDFSFKHENQTYEFQDTWEWNCEEYTLRFVWCCYAIAYAIKQYDNPKLQFETTAGQDKV